MDGDDQWHKKLCIWLNDRVGFSGLVQLAREKQVPVHRHTLWYYFGGMTLFLFMVQVLTGILLLLYYRPSAGEAYESIQFLMTEVEFGWLIRSIHAWAADLMIFAAFVHLFSVLLLKAYRPPREVTWLSGVGLLALVMAFGFTGYLLPWNDLAYFATRVGTEIPGTLPWIGSFLRRLLRGGEEVTGATLTRFYGIHVAILPALTTLLLLLHVGMVQKHGLSVPRSVLSGGGKRSMPFFPNFLLRDLVGWLSALAVLAALAAYYPAELGEKAEPFEPAPAGIKPEWYYMFMFKTLKLLPSRILGLDGDMVGVLAFGGVGLFLFLIPFFDRRSARGWSSPLFTWVGLALLAYMIVLTVLGYTEAPAQ